MSASNFHQVVGSVVAAFVRQHCHLIENQELLSVRHKPSLFVPKRICHVFETRATEDLNGPHKNAY